MRTPDNKNYTEFSFANPVHDEHLPTRFRSLKGLRIDGEPVTFIDEQLPEKIHKSLIEGQKLRKRNQDFDCRVFVALMHGITATDSDTLNPGAMKTGVPSIDAEDATNTSPLLLGGGPAYKFEYMHAVYPAHEPDQVQYVHKLGKIGPICISGLRAAMSMYHAYVAHPL